jgi:single-strand DNA-binding protein
MSLYENCVRIRGFVGKDAMSKTIANGTIFVSFSVATKSSHKDKQGEWVSETFWHRVAAFGKPALDANNLRLGKGDYVEIAGELRSSEYTPRSAKSPRRVWEVRADSIVKLQPPAKRAQENLDAEPVETDDEVPA